MRWGVLKVDGVIWGGSLGRSWVGRVCFSFGFVLVFEVSELLLVHPEKQLTHKTLNPSSALWLGRGKCPQ